MGFNFSATQGNVGDDHIGAQSFRGYGSGFPHKIIPTGFFGALQFSAAIRTIPTGFFVVLQFSATNGCEEDLQNPRCRDDRNTLVESKGVNRAVVSKFSR